MDEVIIFNKTFQERLEEYKAIFDYKNANITTITNEWSFYSEFYIDDGGWKAIWKIPRILCEQMKIPFPNIAKIIVNSVNYSNLTANVFVLEAQSVDYWEQDQQVELRHLWPLKVQDKNTGLNMTSTANTLDMLRFFYSNLVMPWDYDEDEENWLEKHLEQRLLFYYNLNNGAIPEYMCNHINTLLSDARQLQMRREQIWRELNNSQGDINMNCAEDVNVTELIDVEVRLKQIQCEIELLENPVTRDSIQKLKNNTYFIPNINQHEYWFVCHTCSFDDYLKYFQLLKQIVNNDVIKCAHSLEWALHSASSNSTIILSPAKHSILSLGSLKTGGTLKGIPSCERPTITSERGDVLFDCNGDIFFENLNIDLHKSHYGVLVRKGCVSMRNCSIVGKDSSHMCEAIIVAPNSKLELINCDISLCFTAILGNPGSIIVLKNCKIHNVNNAAKISDSCRITMEDCLIEDCEKGGLVLKTKRAVEECSRRSIGFDILHSFPFISSSNVQGCNNKIGDVIISNNTSWIEEEDE